MAHLSFDPIAMGNGVGPIAKDFVAEAGSGCGDARLHPVGDVNAMIGDADLKPDRGSDWSSLSPRYSLGSYDPAADNPMKRDTDSPPHQWVGPIE